VSRTALRPMPDPDLPLFSLFFHENISEPRPVCRRDPGLRALPMLQ
jgi:hypothetical protein